MRERRTAARASRGDNAPYATGRTKAEIQLRHAEERVEREEKIVQGLEVQLLVVQRWQPHWPEYQAAEALALKFQFKRVLDRLELLIIQRLLEFTKMNQSGTSYNLRMHLSKSMQVRSKTIRSAIVDFNRVGALQDLPVPPLDWEDVVEITFLSDFDLLRDHSADIRNCRWARPAYRTLMHRYFKTVRAREEIIRLNVEIRRVLTWMQAVISDRLSCFLPPPCSVPSLIRRVNRLHSPQHHSTSSAAREMGGTNGRRAQLQAMQAKNRERYAAIPEAAEKENDEVPAAHLHQTNTRRPSLRSQLESAQEELTSAHNALSAAEALRQDHERAIAAHEHTISTLRRRLEQSQSQIDLLTSQLADLKEQAEELASELGLLYDGMKKESAKVTRLKRDREKAKDVAGSREAVLVQELAEKNASIELQRRHNSTLDTQLAQAKLVADEHRAKTKAIQAEREKYKKQAQRAKTSLERTRKTLKALQNWDPMDAQNHNMYGSHTRRLMRQLDGVSVSSKHVAAINA
ncbi:hypothetical protein HMN09_01115300 [Mycena chlorophos]|uniref:Uncharacterized protein n=1 Tax=Mycena chlorophos TaxID=658473 RepID=A0A8H6SB79_MYCCL|nr:hypothetical protein HMN09_01115300 [Mycena chlorophos]